jgi:hypothetical protein
MKKMTYSLEIVLEKTGLCESDLLELIGLELISPFDHQNLLFDEEDLRRVELIQQLKDNCHSNYESIQVILHLVDQIHYLRRK